MIDGEIYALDDFPDCVFAFCERGGYKTSFYIGVCSSGSVDLSRSDSIYGMSANSPCHLATTEERERFHQLLDKRGYKWNKTNKVVIKNKTEIIKI